MRNAYMKLVMSLVLAVGLVGCGGGDSESNGGGSGSDTLFPSVPVSDLDPNNIPADRQEEWDDYVTETGKTADSVIIGLYDVSREEDGKTDKGFLSIQKNKENLLVATAYNFMLDDFSNEGA